MLQRPPPSPKNGKNNAVTWDYTKQFRHLKPISFRLIFLIIFVNHVTNEILYGIFFFYEISYFCGKFIFQSLSHEPSKELALSEACCRYLRRNSARYDHYTELYRASITRLTKFAGANQFEQILRLTWKTIALLSRLWEYYVVNVYRLEHTIFLFSVLNMFFFSQLLSSYKFTHTVQYTHTYT